MIANGDVVAAGIAKERGGVTLETTVDDGSIEKVVCSDGVCDPYGSSYGLEFTRVGDTYVLTGIGTCTDSRIVISSVHDGWPVTSIGDCALEDCTQITDVTLFDGITHIGEHAFQGCLHLTNIVIPESVTNIGDYAFVMCWSMTRICIPNGVTYIGRYCFQHCQSLLSITIPDSVTTIGYSAFYGCRSLTSLVLPEGIANIGEFAFSGCIGLTKIIFMGTKEQWNAINKGMDWNYSAPATEIICSDGTVELY